MTMGGQTRGENDGTKMMGAQIGGANFENEKMGLQAQTPRSTVVVGMVLPGIPRCGMNFEDYSKAFWSC